MEPTRVDARIALRAATPADAPRLAHWDDQPHVIESDPNDDWHWETELARAPGWREQLVAELDGRPIGFIQIIDPLETNRRAHVFYERMDFQFVEKRTFGEDRCFVYCLERSHWEAMASK